MSYSGGEKKSQHMRFILSHSTVKIHVTSILKNGGFLSKPLDSGKTFFDFSVNTDQICMGFEADTPGK